jgi:23S rRNA (pseudouridine1915-N3)-methyltransferase
VGRCAEGEGGLKVRLVSFGQTRSDPLGPAVKVYADRLSHYVQFELLELPAQRADRTHANKSGEAQALFRKLRPRDWLVTLDERGKPLSSRDLSVFIARAQSDSHDLLFAIGGDEGLSEEALKRSHLTLSLSRMTLPHRLARLVLIEQIYRAFTIHRGEPYHK